MTSRRTIDTAISRCACHGAWMWHGVCRVTPDRMMRVVLTAAARSREPKRRTNPAPETASDDLSA